MVPIDRSPHEDAAGTMRPWLESRTRRRAFRASVGHEASRFHRFSGFAPLPPTILAALAAITGGYVITTEIAKGRFCRRAPRSGIVGEVVQRPF